MRNVIIYMYYDVVAHGQEVRPTTYWYKEPSYVISDGRVIDFQMEVQIDQNGGVVGR